MGRFMVTSPTFSAFRAGEPIAFELARRAVEIEDKSHFKRYLDGKLVVGKGNIVYVYMNNSDEPFSFICEEI